MTFPASAGTSITDHDRAEATTGETDVRADGPAAHGAAAPGLTFAFNVIVTLGSPVELGTAPAGRHASFPSPVAPYPVRC